MSVVGIGMEQRNGDSLHAGGTNRINQAGNFHIRQRHHRDTIRPHSLVGLNTPFTRDERGRNRRREIVKTRSGVATQRQHIAEPPARDQRSPCGVFRDQCVCADSRPVEDSRSRIPGSLEIAIDADDCPFRRVGRRGRDLERRDDLTRDPINGKDIGERTANVDPENNLRIFFHMRDFRLLPRNHSRYLR